MVFKELLPALTVEHRGKKSRTKTRTRTRTRTRTKSHKKYGW